MTNRSGRAVPVSDFKPQGLLPDGLLPVSRPGGEEFEQVAKETRRVAASFGQIADEAATVEGRRAGKEAGLDPGYRPTGATTLRGRSFEAAATETYQNQLDAQLRGGIQAIYEQNKSSPKKLKEAFDAYGAKFQADNVFKEIEGDYKATFARLRIPYENKAQSDLEADIKDKARATLIQNIATSQTSALRAAVMDPNSPATAASIDIELKRIDQLYDEAASRDHITYEAATKLKAASRNSLMGSAMLEQANKLATPEAVAAYRQNVRDKFAKGEIKHLDAGGFETLDAQLQSLERAKKTGVNAETTKLQKDVGDFVQRAVDGFETSAAEWTGFATQPGASTARGQRVLAVGEAQLKIADKMRNMPVADADHFARSLRLQLQKDGSAPSEDQADLVRFAEKLADTQRKDLARDPLGLAARKRLIPGIVPVDFVGFASSNDPNAGPLLAAQIRDRTAQARAVGQSFERAPVFFRPDEIAQLKAIVDKGGDKALALAGAIVKGADNDTTQVLKEIGGDAPLLAQAGAILVNGGSVQAARDALQAAELRADKLKPGERPALVFGETVRKEYGTAFQLAPETQSRATTAARAIAETRLTRTAADPKMATDLYKRAAQEAAGAVYVDGIQFGGVGDYKPGYWHSYKVAVPGGVRADRFRDVVRSLRPEDFSGLDVKPVDAEGKAYKASDFAAAVPVATRGGYRFALGNPQGADPQFIGGSDGRPFVLPFDRLAPALRARVPGAFLGDR